MEVFKVRRSFTILRDKLQKLTELNIGNKQNIRKSIFQSENR